MFKGLTSTITPFTQEAAPDLFVDMCSDYRKTITIDSDSGEEEVDMTPDEAVFFDSITSKRDDAPLSPKAFAAEEEESDEEEEEEEEFDEEEDEEDSEGESEEDEPKRKKLRKFTPIEDAFISEYYNKYGFKFNKILKNEFQTRLPGISKTEAEQRAGVLFKQYLPRKKQRGGSSGSPSSSSSSSSSPAQATKATKATKKHQFTQEEDAIIKVYYLMYGLNFRAIPKDEFRKRLPGMNGCKNQAKSRAKVLFNYKAPATEAEDMLIEMMRKAGTPSKDVVIELNKLNPPEKHRQTYFVDNRYKVIRNSNQREWGIEECYALCELFEEHGGDFIEMSKDRSGVLHQRPIAHMRAKYIQLTENL